jgi:hypothetical protein
MMKQQVGKIILSACAIVLIASVQVHAVADMAAASATLSEVDVMVVQAKTRLAEATNDLNVEATAEAANRSIAVDAARAEAAKAYSDLKKAVDDGDEAAATTATEELAAARQKAFDALNGVVAPVVELTEQQKWIKKQTNTGGGPGYSYDSPNIYNQLSQTQGLSQFYQAVWGVFQSSTGNSGGGGIGFDDKDATQP